MYYLLWRGTVTGPFPLEKITRMLKSRQISPLYKISTDKQAWETIKKMEIFNNGLSVEVSAPEKSNIPKVNQESTDSQPISVEYTNKTSRKPPGLRVKRPNPAINNGDDIALGESIPFSQAKDLEDNDNAMHLASPKNTATIACPMCGAENIQVDFGLPTGTCRYCLTEIPLTPLRQNSTGDDAINDNFPGYCIDRVLGRGGMGVVYQAQQARLNNRKVALKVLFSEMASSNQIENEVAALVELAHPSIVTIFDLVSSGDKTAIVMELILGPAGEPLSLRDIMTLNGPVQDYAAAIAVCKAICAPLAYAHRHGIFHLDLKPENILIDHLGHIKIVDFGIARFDNTAQKAEGINKTVSSDLYGTVGYSAPERRTKGLQPHANQDVYSLGVILYELLMGELPGGRLELPSELNSEMPAVFDSLIETSLNYHHERRFATMEVFDHALLNAQKIVKAGNSKSKRITTKHAKEDIHPVKEKGATPFNISIKNPKIRIK